MPESGTDGHVTLLLAEHLTGVGPTPLPRLHAFVRDAARRHAAYWRSDATAAGAEVELTAQALRRLEALRLVERGAGPGGDTVRPLPALARYAVGEPEVSP